MFWFLIIIVALIIEFITTGVFAVWFAIGAFVAYVFSILGFSIWVQCIGAVATVICTLILVRPFAVKMFNEGQTQSKIKSLIGKDAIVLTEINAKHSTGLVRIGDAEWAAVPSNRKNIYQIGEVVRIVKTGNNYVVVSSKGDK